MITFQFDTAPSVVNCRVTVIRPGQIFNVGTPGNVVGWEDLPPDGKTLDAHKITPTPFAPKGDYANTWQVEIPASADDLDLARIAVFASDANGKLGDRLGTFSAAAAVGPVVIYAANGSVVRR